MKGMFVPGTLFEELGFNYIGPIDGHDINTLVKTLRNLQKQKGPRFLHVVTRKGKGFQPAEDNPLAYHGVGKFHPESGKLEKKTPTGPTYTKVFSDWLVDMAHAEERLIGITPAMCEGSGLVEFAKEFPDRYFDVGIAEQHAVTFAAGLACEQFKPVVAIYSTFLQRAYDQLIHDVALQNLPVLFAIDRAGIVGPDGPTHAGTFDLSYLRCIPNMLVMAPADENECRQMLSTGFHHDGPAAVRYPRGQGPGASITQELTTLPIGKAEVRRHGEHVAILAFGCMVTEAEKAGDALNATVVNMRFVKPLDETLLQDIARHHDLLVTIEDNAVLGGAGSAVNEYLAQANLPTPVINLGLPDSFLPHGEREAILADVGLCADGIIRQVDAFMQHLPHTKHATHA